MYNLNSNMVGGAIILLLAAGAQDGNVVSKEERNFPQIYDILLMKTFDDIINKLSISDFSKTDIEHAFNKLCFSGNLNDVQMLYTVYESLYGSQIKITTNVFSSVCIKNRLDIAKWLYDIIGDIITHNEISNIFIEVCIYDRLDMIKWLYGLNRIDIDTLNIAFTDSCIHTYYTYTNLDVIKWLYSTNLILIDYMSIIKKVRGLNIIQWLYNLDQTMFTSKLKEELFIINYQKNKIDIMKWLIELGGFDLSIHREDIFINICKSGKLDDVKWFYLYMAELGDPINIRSNDDSVFKQLWKNYKFYKEIISWLCSMCDSYKVEFDDYNVKYTIDNIVTEIDPYESDCEYDYDNN
jgi:hypothetical protein